MPVETQTTLRESWATPRTMLGWLATVDHKQIGVRYMVTSFVFFGAAGIMAMLMRTQLAQAEATVLSPQAYNQVFTMHGTTMIFLFATPMVTGISVYVLPLILGTRNLAFPRLNAFTYWVFLFSGVFLFTSFALGEAPDMGWFGYTPLSGHLYTPGIRGDFYALGISFVGISTIGAAANFIVTIFKLRAPGMAIQRIPLFGWGVLDMAFAMILAVPLLTVATGFLALDRTLGTQFYNPDQGGSPLLWQHMFWMWGHPEVYILLLPALGIISSVIAVFAQRAIIQYSLVIVASVSIFVLSFGLWVHHMFAVGLPLNQISLFTANSLAISVASGVTIFAWLGTLWGGRIVWRTPLLFALGFIVTFVIGGITGVMVAVVPFDWQVHDTYFVVAHFHYVLVGGVVFPILAGLHYWLPKITGRMLSEGSGQLSFWLVFLGFNLTFFPQHILGLLGMPRRVYTYLVNEGWQSYNLASTIGSYILGVGFLLFLVNAAWSFRYGRLAGDNPWKAHTLEWATSSPPPPYNFESVPLVHSRTPLWGGHEAEEGVGMEWSRDPMSEGREVVVTSILDGGPESVYRPPVESLAPLATALSLGLALTGAMLDSFWVFVAGIVLVLLSVAVWSWRPHVSVPARLEAFEGEHVPHVAVPTSVSIAWWGMMMFIVAEAALFVGLISSYFFTRADSTEWPQTGITPPELALPIVLTVLLLLGSVAMYLGERAGREGKRASSNVGVVAAVVLALAFLSLQGFEYSRQPFQLDTNAYSSLFYVITGLHGLHVTLGVLMVGWMAARSRFLGERAARDAVLGNVAWYWHFVGAVWLAIFLSLYLAVRWV